MTDSERKTVVEWIKASTRYSQGYLDKLSDEEIEDIYVEKVLRGGFL
ncbi:BH0509 family protein [Lentibacillus salinarum]|uniref:BH0509 family protein n=1 Tax=Lentibacillus salinarum TaxID=446820 RepID=A0ABW3ZY00_9BACI